MKMFKIIEEGRILSNYALAQVQGGGNVCIDESTYRICSNGTKFACTIVEIVACASKVTCGGRLTICSDGMKHVCGGDKLIVVSDRLDTLN